MQTPLRITYRNLDSSMALSKHIQEEAEKLEGVFDRITGCHVVLEVPHHHQSLTPLVRVRVDLFVPGEVLTVGKSPPKKARTPRDPYLEVTEAFTSMRRQLESHLRRMRQDVKLHVESPRARVSRLEGDFGMLETPDGREIYFHRHSVLNDAFDRLELGSEVRFAEELGDKGPQASTVAMASRNRRRAPAQKSGQPGR
jgi:cold shock CspA family protein/ribosome-associated translation inhibitor RaiA